MFPSCLYRSIRFASTLGVSPSIRRINPPKNMYLVSNLALIDFDKILNNVASIEENFAARKILIEIDPNLLKELYSTLKKLYRRKLNIIGNMNEVDIDPWNGNSIMVTKSDNSPPNQHFLDYYNFYRNFVLKYCLHLPNYLHEKTPLENDETIIVKNSETSNLKVYDHVQTGTRLGILRYINPSSYYLLNAAAVFERAVVRYSAEYLENLKFVPFHNPDTCNESLLSALVLEDINDVAFKLSREYYLVGGASFALFCTYRINSVVNKKFLPERFFTCARRYTPPRSCEENGLYTSCQRSNIHLFIAAYTYENMMKEFEQFLISTTNFYETLGLNFRMHFAKASKLKLAESCRVCIQLYSPYRKDFVDVGYLSIYDDFVSKRLRMMCHDHNRFTSFIHVIEGVLIDIPVLIACLLERSSHELLIPPCIRPYMNRHLAVEQESGATLP